MKTPANHPAPSSDSQPKEVAARLIQELQTHQIQLEMQNEELRRAQAELEAARARYFDFYNLAPVGYVTLNEPGRILEVNLTATTLLGMTRDTLLQQPLARFFFNEDQSTFARLRRQLFATGVPLACELRLVKRDGTQFWGQLAATLAQDAGGVPVCRIVLSDVTARQQAEAASRESEARYHSLVEQSPDTVGVYQEGELVFINAAGAQLLGAKTTAELRGRKIEQIVCPADLPGARDRLRRRLTGEPGLYPAEVRYRRLDGTTLPVEVTAAPITFAGKPAVQFIARDITKRLQAAAALRQSEERHQTILQTAADGFWRVDLQGRLLEVNQAYCRMSGYGEAELLAMSIADLEAAESSPVTADHMQKVVAQGEDHFESRHRRKDGSIFSVEVSVQHKSTEGGYLVAFLHDITVRQRAEEALRESEARFRELFENSPDAVFVEDPSGTLLDVNPAACRLHGFSREELLGKNVLDLVPSQSRDEVHARFAQWFTHQLTTCEGVAYRADGRLVTVDICGTPIRYRGQTAVLLHVRDMTERKQMEEELFTSRKQLRALAARLQAVREEERTSVAREIHDVLAQELTRLKMDVVWVNRQLARPLDARKQKAVQERLTAMTTATDTAIQSVQKIATELRPVVLDSLGLCAAVEWQVKEFAARTGIACRATVPEQDLLLDRNRSTAMFRILQESLTNVQRHAQATRVEVLLLAETDQLVLRIQDNGCGIPPATLSNPMAIGLVGMRERALLLEGQLEIRSQPKAGTVIEMRLPLSLSANQPEGEP